MAAFDITPQETQPRNNTNASQGVRASADTGLGNLFSDVAGIVDQGIKEADRYTQEKIREDIFDEVDAINDEFGVGDATFQERDEEALARPSQLQAAGENLDRLQAAYERGGLRESHYWGRMNSMVRQLRQRYPGYRPEIDQMVSSITGARPANALRRSLFQEWSAASAGSGDELGDLEEWAMKNGNLPTDYYDRQQTDNPYSLNELQVHVSRKTSEAAEITRRRAALGLQVDQGSVTTAAAERAWRAESNQLVTTLLQDTTGSYQQVNQRIREAQQAAASGRPMDQGSVDELRTMYGQLRSDVSLALQQQFVQPWDSNPNHSYASQIDPTDAQNIINQALLPLDIMGNALADENFGTLQAMTTYLEGLKTDTGAVILEQVPFAQNVAGLNSILGPELSSIYFDTNPAMQMEMADMLINLDVAGMHTRTETVSDSFTRAESVGEDVASEVARGTIQRWQNIAEQVSKEELPLSVVRENVDFMFGGQANQIMTQLSPDSRMEYFRQVATPRVTKQMVALRDQGDVEAWNTYQTWVTGSFMNLFRQSIQEINQANTDPNSGDFRVSWNPATKSFVFDQQFVVGSRRGELGGDLNTAIRTITPIIEANGGNAEDELFNILGQMGYDREARTQIGWDPVMNLYNALRGYVSFEDMNPFASQEVSE